MPPWQRAGEPGHSCCRRHLRTSAVALCLLSAFGCRAPDAAQAPPGGARPAEPATTTTLAASTTDLPAALAVAPELTPESARMLLETAPGATVDFVARASLLQATQGFNHLSPEELRDLGATFAKAYEHLETGERARLEAYLRQVRMGDAGRPEEEARARKLFNAAVLALPAGDRGRLQALYARAIAASLAANREATQHASERALLMADAPPSLPATLGTQPERLEAATGTGSGPRVLAESTPSRMGRGEAYWRRRAQQLRANVVRLEKDAAELDARATNLAYGAATSRGMLGETAAEASARGLRNAVAQRNWEVQRAKAMKDLERARHALAAARLELDGLEDEARRDGALPGWLR